MSGRLNRFLLALLVLASCSKKSRDDKPVAPKVYPPGSGRAGTPVCGPREAGKPQPQGGDCLKDDDCKTGKEGRCNALSDSHGRMAPENRCTYSECAGDADCKEGPCECDSMFGNHCLAGNCKTNADCPGSICDRSNSMNCWGGPAAYYCRTAKDTCTDSEECQAKDGKGRGGQCVYLPELGHWGCQEYPECPVG
jgi:hypothetical protein